MPHVEPYKKFDRALFVPAKLKFPQRPTCIFCGSKAVEYHGYTPSTLKHIANHNNVSPSTVVNVLNESVTISSFTLHDSLPEHLCFDEVRTNDNQLSFICIDAVKHTLMALLPGKFSYDIEKFFNGFSLAQRARVKTVTTDLNA